MDKKGLGNLPFKVTGVAHDGRYDFHREGWNVVRMPPKFFVKEEDAVAHLDTYEAGILWTRGVKDTNTYTVYLTLNTQWPEGARKTIKKKYSTGAHPLDKALAKQNK